MITRSGSLGYKAGAAAYARMGVESQVMSASPHELITLLYSGARTAIRTAKLHMANGNMAAKGEAIARALDIVTQGLMGCLDQEQGGEVAQNLADIYDYIGRQLLWGSLHNDPEKLDEADQLLAEIESSWNALAQLGKDGAE